MTDLRRSFTVWRFQSIAGEIAVVAKYSEPRDIDHQHEYQQILWRGLAHSKAEAINLAAS